MTRIKSVLVLARDPMRARLLEARLEHSGWIQRYLRGFSDALEILRQVRPAVVLVDTTDLADARAVVAGLRATPLMAGVPIVAVTTPSISASIPGTSAELPHDCPSSELVMALEESVEGRAA